MAPSNRVRRRAFLGTVGAAFVGLAGCSDSNGPSENDTQTETAAPTSTTTETSTETATPDGTPTETATPEPQQRPPWMVNEGELYDDFATFEADWAVQSGSATLVDGEGFVGAPALRLETADGNGLVRIERRYYQPVDFSNRELSMAVKLEETTVSSPEVTIRLQDIDGTRLEYSDVVPKQAAGEWLRLDPGAKSPEPFDLSQVTRVRIEHFAREGNASTLLVSDVRTTQKREKGTVVFAFEGDNAESFSLAYPVLNDAGYAGGVFAAPDSIGGTSTPTIDDYRTMRDDGWDIAALPLGRQRLSEFGDEERAAVEGAISQLSAKGFDGATNVFRPTRGDYTDTTLGYADELFDLTFVGVGASLGSNSSLTDTRTVLSIDADSLSKARECVDAAAEHRQTAMLVFTTRHLDDREAFASLVDHVKRLESDGALDVVTPTELASRDA